LAIRAGALWVAANRDATMPSPRGQVPGNGALVAALEVATGCTPVVAGKPELALHLESVARVSAARPLVVGDRLDTDIDGATRAGCDSVLVLSGVTDRAMLLAAPPGLRPTYLSPDVGGLLRPHPTVEVYVDYVRCGQWVARLVGGAVVTDRDVTAPALVDGDDLDEMRAAAELSWVAADRAVSGGSGSSEQ